MRRSRPEGQEAAAAAAAERLKEQRSKQSIEEREAAYRLARARIFGDESSNVSEKSTKSKKHGRRRSGSNEGSGTGSAESLIDENQAMTGSTESLKKHWPKATPPVEDFETYNRNPSLGYGGFMNPMAMQYWGMPYIPMGTPSNVPLSSHPMPMMANGIPNNQQMLGGYNDSGNVYMSGISPMGPWNPNIGSNNGSNGPGWGAPWNGQGGWNYNQMDEISNRVKGDQSYRPSSAEHSSGKSFVAMSISKCTDDCSRLIKKQSEGLYIRSIRDDGPLTLNNDTWCVYKSCTWHNAGHIRFSCSCQSA